MKLFRLFILVTVATSAFGAMAETSKKSDCVIKAEDPVVQQFYRAQGFEVDSDKGDFQVEFEVTCESVDVQIEKFGQTEKHQTTTKLMVFNDYENQKVIYHSDEISAKSGPVEGKAFVVPCMNSKPFKLKLLEGSLKALEDINCSEED